MNPDRIYRDNFIFGLFHQIITQTDRSILSFEYFSGSIYGRLNLYSALVFVYYVGIEEKWFNE